MCRVVNVDGPRQAVQRCYATVDEKLVHMACEKGAESAGLFHGVENAGGAAWGVGIQVQVQVQVQVHEWTSDVIPGGVLDDGAVFFHGIVRCDAAESVGWEDGFIPGASGCQEGQVGQTNGFGTTNVRIICKMDFTHSAVAGQLICGADQIAGIWMIV